MEMEATVLAAQDEILRKEEELAHMRDLLILALKERDEAQYKCQKLQLVQKHHLLLLNSVSLSNNDQKKALVCRDTKTISLSSSNTDETIISDPLNPHLVTPSSSSALSSSLPPNYVAATLGKQRTLPEKGRLLQAVMEAGPLPQWQHPPPQLHRIQIPPVTPVATSKRGLGSCFDGSVCSSPNYSKYQRVS